MPMTADKILEIARREIGTKESPANSNRVKYNTEYYGQEVSGSGYPWCCAFVWWCFKRAGASGLFFGGGKTAYCPTLKNYHKAQAVTDYRPGDVIFFNFSGGTGAKHVGICESWDGKSITTIDGNTGSGDQANGGAVMRQKRAKKYIVGAYRPAYQREGQDMTEAQVKQIAQEVVRAVCAQQDGQAGYERFRAFMERYRQDLAGLSAPAWAVKNGELERAVDLGLTDGSRPQDFATRAEVASMIARACRT